MTENSTPAKPTTGLPVNALKNFAQRNNKPADEVETTGPTKGSAFHPAHVLADTRRAQAQGPKDEYFEDYFDDSDEEAALSAIRQDSSTFVHQNKYSEIEERLKSRLRKLRQEYPRGGIKAFQFITTNELLDAPADFFSRFEKEVQEVTRAVQTSLSEKGKADLVGQAQAHPFDEEIQDTAFRVVQNMTNEELERRPYKGIERSIVVYMVSMDIIGMSRIEPLWRDRTVDEILCNGPFDVQVERAGKLYQVPACQFRDPEHLEQLLERVSNSIGKSLSRTTPLLDGRLYDQSRIFASDRRVSPEGPNVSIRRHPEKFWTPMDLVAYGSASEEMLTDLGNWINKGCSYIVIGGTSTGKTSFLNATSGFYAPSERVVTLEDNLELKLNPHKWLAAPMECVQPNPQNPNDYGVTMRDLVKASLRMRPNGIVIGEVRDGAMYDLCQALNTGHWGASTVHANSPFDGIYRMQSLVTQAEVMGPEQALPLIAAAFDLIIMLEHFPEDGSRKITSICEIDPYPKRGEGGSLSLDVRELWKFEAQGVVEGRVTGTWNKLSDMSEIRQQRRHLDLTANKTWPELVELCTI